MATVVCVSDTHLRHQFEVPAGDILIHAGDLTMSGSVEEVEEGLDWLASFPHRWKVLIAGNHDFLFERAPDEARRLVRKYEGKGLRYLQDEEVVVEGIRIYGSPWQPWFMDWAFNLSRGPALKAKWDLIPGGVDILVTHGPPAGIMDFVLRGDRVGCEELLPAVKRTKPAFHIFGHIHGAHGVVKRGETLFVNACICGEDYSVSFEPVVLKVTKEAGKKAKSWKPNAAGILGSGGEAMRVLLEERAKDRDR